MQAPDTWKANVVGADETVGAVVGTAETVGAGEIVGVCVGDGTRHTRHPDLPTLPSDDHKMFVDELTATQSGPEVPE